MLQSLSTPSTLPSCDQQDSCINFSPLRDFRPTSNFNQPLRTNVQDRCRIRLQSCRFEYNNSSPKSENEPNTQQENENTDKPQKPDLYAVRLLEKLIKEKNTQMESEQSTKKTTQTNKTVNILGERSLNVSLDRKDEQEPKFISDLQNKFKQITVPPRRPVNRARDENNPNIVPVPKKEPASRTGNLKKLENCSISQILFISKTSINFGTQMPGQIVNETLDIVNKTNQDLVVQIFLDCEDSEFKELDEYVYSIRRSNCYEYNDKHFLIMTPYSSASFKVGLKVPTVNRECENRGHMDISIQGLKTIQRIDLESRIVVPKVICPKTLYHKEARCEVISLAVQKGKRHDFKLPLRNQSSVPVEVEFFFHNREDASEEDEAFDCFTSPQPVVLDGNGAGVINICIKGTRRELKKKTIKKVLLGKVKGTGIVYSFCICIQVY